MILDRIENLYKYEKLHPTIKDVITFIKNNDLNKIPVEKRVINDKLLYNLQEYMGKEETNKYESHIKYIDIQLVISGEEYINYSFDKPLVNEIVDNDMYISESNNKNTIKLTSGYFAIFLPNELHNPGIKCNDSKIKKIIFKVLAS